MKLFTIGIIITLLIVVCLCIKTFYLDKPLREGVDTKTGVCPAGHPYAFPDGTPNCCIVDPSNVKMPKLMYQVSWQISDSKNAGWPWPNTPPQDVVGKYIHQPSTTFRGKIYSITAQKSSPWTPYPTNSTIATTIADAPDSNIVNMKVPGGGWWVVNIYNDDTQKGIFYTGGERPKFCEDLDNPDATNIPVSYENVATWSSGLTEFVPRTHDTSYDPSKETWCRNDGVRQSVQCGCKNENGQSITCPPNTKCENHPLLTEEVSWPDEACTPEQNSKIDWPTAGGNIEGTPFSKQCSRMAGVISSKPVLDDNGVAYIKPGGLYYTTWAQPVDLAISPVSNNECPPEAPFKSFDQSVCCGMIYQAAYPTGCSPSLAKPPTLPQDRTGAVGATYRWVSEGVQTNKQYMNFAPAVKYANDHSDGSWNTIIDDRHFNPALHLGDHGETKMLLRSAFTDKVPERILNRSDKIGFVANESRWFSTNIDLVIDTLKSCKNIPFVDYQAISEDVYNRYKHGYQHHSAIWRAFNLARWYNMA